MYISSQFQKTGMIQMSLSKKELSRNYFIHHKTNYSIPENGEQSKQNENSNIKVPIFPVYDATASLIFMH